MGPFAIARSWTAGSSHYEDYRVFLRLARTARLLGQEASARRYRTAAADHRAAFLVYVRRVVAHGVA